MEPVVGLLLAAGAGSRMGMPKAAVVEPDGTSWLARAGQVLHDGGCARVVALLGACGGTSAALAPDLEHELCADWHLGLSATLAHGLRLLDATSDATAAVIHLVDLPDVTAAVVRRVVGDGASPASLRRATYGDVVGHPVLLGREHWLPIAEWVTGDAGAGGYLTSHGAERVECGDLATGADKDGDGA
jgi:CTP:molybdopterin cytidylyltransferase MocA